MSTHSARKPSLHHISPTVRLLISLGFAGSLHFIIPATGSIYLDALIFWDLFACFYLAMCWAIFITTPIKTIRHNASKEDGSIIYVFAMIILSSFAGMVAVLLMIKDDAQTINPLLSLTISILAMVFSWAIVHSIFTFHYGHLFYSQKPEGGLMFPGEEKEPDYLDLAYFSFGIGCTFQVADVGITSGRIRKLVLLHSLLSFMLNTFVVALSINIIGGLIK